VSKEILVIEAIKQGVGLEQRWNIACRLSEKVATIKK
jgi:hypothetical protein